MSAGAAIASAAAAAALLVGTYALAGGGDYEPTPTADPCAAREWRDPQGIEEVSQQFALSALDGAACELETSRERLAVGLATEEARAELAADLGIGEPELEEAVRAGVVRAVDDAEAAGELSPAVATALRAVGSRLPVDEAIAVIEDGGEFIDDAGSVLDDLGGLLGEAEGLLP